MTPPVERPRPWAPGTSGAWLTLPYLPLYALPWLWERPSPADLAGSAAGLALFLPLYLLGSRLGGAALAAASAGVLAISIALSFAGANWPVIAIYAAVMAGGLRPPLQAGVAIGVFAAVAAGFSLLTGQPLFLWLFGVFMMVMVGLATVSRAALEDKNRALAAAQDEVRAMAAGAERERIARDLHDLLGRTLTLVALKAELAARLAPGDAEAAGREMREVATAAREALAEVRAAVSGMTGASLAREIAASRTALQAAGIDCSVEGEADGIAPGAGAVLAMTLREAVTNVIRHSGARRCRIVVDAGAGEVRLTVADDGSGADVREGGGIGGIRGRLAAAGGALLVEGGASGTRLVASLPGAAAG